ncbi:MAG: hypothetical protein JJ899_03175 [Alphaproteobacteria bacterium]|nr:hypothetical protein [Alphaproteobacteria bacterium]
MSYRTGYLIAAAVLLATALPAHAQQVVETSSGKQVSGHDCSVSQASLAAIRDAETDRKADTRAKLESLLDSALASPKTRQTAQSPVVFPPARPGS